MKKYKKIITLMALWLIAGTMLFILSSVWPRANATGKDSMIISSSAVVVPSAENDTMPHLHSASSATPNDRKKLRAAYKENKKTLVLVNGKKKLKKKDSPSLVSICNGRLQASEYLHDSLVRMLADARKEGYSYFIASAYRSRKKQQKLVDDGVRKRMKMGLPYDDALNDTNREIMPAGHSEHETGLALDILCAGNMQMDISQKSEPGNAWLQANCYKYGFILRYPEGKEPITGISYEPWHFRYVGERAATYMREENITLEEFWQRLGK